MQTEQDEYNELSLYTLEKGDPAFIHQHIVDAFTVQNADTDTKPIALAFALIGLYLYVEKMYSGRSVQLAHMKMAEVKKDWPGFTLPELRGDIRVGDVLKAPPGQKRDDMILKWARSVWDMWHENRQEVCKLVAEELGV